MCVVENSLHELNDRLAKYRILLVEDETSLSEVIRLNLELEGYHVTDVAAGKQALEKLRTARFDLCIMDVMLPEIDGFAVVRTIRLENNKTPVLFLTAKNSSADRIEGLRLGGDDYLAKPFNLEELLLRVEKLIVRRKENGAPLGHKATLNVGEHRINTETFEVSGPQHNGMLSAREVKLLRLLVESSPQVVSREEILEKVWGYDVFPSTRTIDNYILGFRKYFEPDSRHPRYFHSVRGVGYKFTP